MQASQKKYDVIGMKAFHDEDPCQTVGELSETLSADTTTVRKHLHKVKFI